MKPLAERATAIVDYCKQHPDMQAAGYVSLILNRSDERVVELEQLLSKVVGDIERLGFVGADTIELVGLALAGKVGNHDD